MLDGEEEGNNNTKEHVSGGQPHSTGMGTIKFQVPLQSSDNMQGMHCESTVPLQGEDTHLGKEQNEHLQAGNDDMQS